MKTKEVKRYKTWMFYNGSYLHPLWAGTGRNRREAYEIMAIIEHVRIPYSRNIKSKLWN